MKNEFIPYDIALAMKELGFDEICLGRYSGLKRDFKQFGFFRKPRTFDYSKDSVACLAPLYQQAFRWFREKGYQSEILWRGDMNCFCHKIGTFEYGSHTFSEDNYNTYEEAELACLRKLIEILNQTKDE